jgi:two-component system response regulator FixJ
VKHEMTDLIGTVHIIDDDEQVLKSVALLVRSVGLTPFTYSSGEEFLGQYKPSSSHPECLLVDLCMRGMSGLQLQEELNARGYEVPLIVLTAFGDVPAAAAAFRGGALDFIEKPFSRTMLVERVSEALSRHAQEHEQQIQSDRIEHRLETLSPREREVFELLVTGKTAKEIGFQFDIGAKTVAKHRAKVLRKLNVESVSELIHLAYRFGLCNPS